MINNNEEVAGIYLQTFAHHWAACQDRLQAYEPLRKHWSLISGKLRSCLWKTLVLALENPDLVSGKPWSCLWKTPVLALEAPVLYFRSLVLSVGTTVLSLKILVL
jgi:hypothetical protein